MHNELVESNLKSLFQVLPTETEENHRIRVPGLRVKIEELNFPDTKQKYQDV